MTRPRIGYVGMTHLGVCSAVAAAERGFDVLGYDPAKGPIEALQKGQLSVVEPDLGELFQKNRERLRFTAKLPDLSGCDLVFVACDVATDDEGESDLDDVERLLAEVRPALGRDATLVLQSQVPPGFTRGHLSDREQLYYQVETLAFGQAMTRALNPERFIVGCAAPTRSLPATYRSFLESFDCPILTMRYESAELAKISINLCLVATITATNTLAEICERIGADWSEIAPALRLDRRIGKHAYLGAGLGIAGGNLERDLATLRRLAARDGTDPGLVEALLANSRHRRDWALRALHTEILSRVEKPTVAILGLAYKAETASTKNSPALGLISALQPFRLQVYDPVVQAVPSEGVDLSVAPSAIDACRGADAVAIMTPWREFQALAPEALAGVLRGRCVVDPYRVLDGTAYQRAGLDYLTLGAPPLRTQPA